MSTDRATRHVLDVGRLVAGGSAYISFLRVGRGEPVLLLHGFASDASDDWIETGWFGALVTAGFDVVAPDLRGHGESVKSRDPADYRLDAYTGDVAALCDYCWGDLRFSLVGYSMGAHVAMSVALASADRVASLVLGGMGDRIAATVGLAPEFANALDGQNGPSGDRREPPSYAVRFGHHAASRPFNDLAVLAACLRGQSAVFDLGRLSAVTAPTLVIVREQDKLAGAPYRVAALFPAGVGQTLPGVNHASGSLTKTFASERWRILRAMPQRSSHRGISHDSDEIADLRHPACSVWKVRLCDGASACGDEAGVRLGRHGAGVGRAGCGGADACHLRAHPICP
jgi:pimeloyl-ACP methyl ester carboxylesterase